MKDRYFGDIYDYVKYALIRQLTDPESPPTVVCWMLTEDDGRKDGRRTKYLTDPEKWSSFEPLVFEFLRHQVLELNTRSISAIERSNVLPNSRFYSEILTDDRTQRQQYFDQFLRFARGAGFVFFDPDNGVQVKSVKYGQRNSSKYLYWTEIGRARRADQSLLIYQHLPPKPRRPFIDQVTEMLLHVCRSGVVYAIRTSKVAFFLVPRRDGLKQIRESLSIVERKWEGFLSVSEHFPN